MRPNLVVTYIINILILCIFSDGPTGMSVTEHLLAHIPEKTDSELLKGAGGMTGEPVLPPGDSQSHHSQAYSVNDGANVAMCSPRYYLLPRSLKQQAC